MVSIVTGLSSTPTHTVSRTTYLMSMPSRSRTSRAPLLSFVRYVGNLIFLLCGLIPSTVQAQAHEAVLRRPVRSSEGSDEARGTSAECLNRLLDDTVCRSTKTSKSPCVLRSGSTSDTVPIHTRNLYIRLMVCISICFQETLSHHSHRGVLCRCRKGIPGGDPGLV